MPVRSFIWDFRAVGRSENPGVVIRWASSVPLVEIGLTDLPKSGGAMAPPAPPGTTPLDFKVNTQDINAILR